MFVSFVDVCFLVAFSATSLKTLNAIPLLFINDLEETLITNGHDSIANDRMECYDVFEQYKK
ncbi:hypothetical protein MAR_033882 [Mya arenaria]|uniref:Uncharacterized protein n=1 Tax=Mya arenaria TaxID=6604 RepID=A0ABY7GA93_MYAAR|nr:hypothetical protein MAR_033882 [Mya arenaria]